MAASRSKPPPRREGGKGAGLLSMTGFGAAAARAGGWRAEAELRAVNGRYLTLKIHLAGEYAFLEEPLRELLEKALVRGSADLRVEVWPERAGASVRLDEERVRAYVAAWRALARKLRLSGEPTVESLAAQPEFFLAAGARSARERALPAALAAAKAALERLGAMRAREGAALAREFRMHLDAVEDLRRRIVERAPEAVRQMVARAAERVRKLAEAAPGAEPRAEDLARELAWWADRCDVAEELQRLASHVAQFRAALAAGGPAGKRLDFLVQELHREANTAGSKAADTAIAGLVLELKVVIEKLREQAQNVL